MLIKKEFLLILLFVFLWLFGETIWQLALFGGVLVFVGILVRVKSNTLKGYLLGNFILSFGYCFLVNVPHLAFILMNIIYFFVYKNIKTLVPHFSQQKFFLNKMLVSLFLLLFYFSFALVKGKGLAIRLLF